MRHDLSACRYSLIQVSINLSYLVIPIVLGLEMWNADSTIEGVPWEAGAMTSKICVGSLQLGPNIGNIFSSLGCVFETEVKV